MFEGSSFDKNSRNYLNGIEDNLQKIKTLYGDTWIMRLYHDISEDSESAGKICEIACKNSQIELCNVKNQKSNNNIQIAGNNQDGEQQIHRIYPLIWRFLPILDPNVDILLSRDLDSTITHRYQQSFTSLKADLCQSINGDFAFSRCANGTFPRRKCSVKALGS